MNKFAKFKKPIISLPPRNDGFFYGANHGLPLRERKDPGFSEINHSHGRGCLKRQYPGVSKPGGFQRGGLDRLKDVRWIA